MGWVELVKHRVTVMWFYCLYFKGAVPVTVLGERSLCQNPLFQVIKRPRTGVFHWKDHFYKDVLRYFVN